jgi:type II secretory pathway component PulF
MPDFYYKALDASGKNVTGVIEMPSRKEVINKLSLEGLRPLEISEKALALPNKKLFSWNNKNPKRSAINELAFLNKLLQLHKGGLALGEVLKILSLRLTDPVLKNIANQLLKHLREGQTLAQAIKQHPEFFDPSLVYLIEAGEATGNLVPVLENVVMYLEGSMALRKRVLSSLAYPIFISLVALGVVAIFLFFLLPRIEGMLSSLGGQLSLPAKILIGLAHFLINGGPFVIGGIFLGVLGIMRYRQSPEGRAAYDHFLLKMPYVKELVINSDLCRVANLLGTLLGSGVNMTEALKLAERSISNTALVKEFQAARFQIADGAAFSVAFRRSRLFPPMGLDIMSVGENTGDLVPSLREIAKVQSEALASQFQFLTGFIASAALAFAFALVVILTLGIVTSILQLSQNIR